MPSTAINTKTAIDTTARDGPTMMPLNQSGALINFPFAAHADDADSQILYRVTWDGYTIPWYITAESPAGALAKVRMLRADRRLPHGLRVVPLQEPNRIVQRGIVSSPAPAAAA